MQQTVNESKLNSFNHIAMKMQIMKFAIFFIGFIVLTPFNQIPAAELSELEISPIHNTDSIKSDVQTAEYWELSVEEFEFVKDLKRRNRGLLSQNLTPLEWLGIFATSESSRMRYAKLFAQRQLEITNAILKFETAYAHALKELTQNKKSVKFTNNKLLLITSIHCNSGKCEKDLELALAHAERGGLLEVAIQEKISMQGVQSWANLKGVPTDTASQNRIRIDSGNRRIIGMPLGLYQANQQK